MNHVNTNRINSYIYPYRIKDTKEHFNKIGEVITQREFYVYHKTLYMIDMCRKIEEYSIRISDEICLEKHRELLENLTKPFLPKNIKYKTSRRKNWTRIFCWKSIFNDKHLQWFEIIVVVSNLVLSSVYYKLLNTSSIFTYNCWKHCLYDKLQRCRSKPMNGIMFVMLELLIT